MNEKSKKYLKAGLVSVALSFVLLILTYVYWNLSYTYDFGDNVIVWSAKKMDLWIGRKFDDSKVVPVNVAYDKVFVPYIDERDNTVAGVRAVTDRKKLLEFFKMLKNRDAYGYVLCDIGLDEFETEYDEELFATIASMRDIVVASCNPEQAPAILREKVADVTYESRKVGDLYMKYDYVMSDGSPSVALKIWEDLTGGKIKRKWWGWSSDGRVCLRSIIPDFRYSIYDDISDAGGRHMEGSYMYSSKMYNLGANVVEPYLDGDISGKFYDGKFIILGDFTENDIHSTISGNQPGPVIIFNALLALINGDNIYSFWIYLLLFVVFWLESMFLLRDHFHLELRLFRPFRKLRAWVYRSRKVKTRDNIHMLLYKILGFLGYNTPLLVLALFIYVASGVFVNALVVGTVFWVISWFV